MKLTQAQLGHVLDALRSIDLYVLPHWTKDGERYVKLEHAQQLKAFAKEALRAVGEVE